MTEHLINDDLGIDSFRYHRLDGDRGEYGSRSGALRQSLGLDRCNRWTAKSLRTLRTRQPTNRRSLKRKGRR
jgi:hypothetical protein